MVVGVRVCVKEKDTVPVVMTDALKDAVLEALDTTAEVEAVVTTEEDGVAYGGRFKLGVAVGQPPAMHGLTSFAPRT